MKLSERLRELSVKNKEYCRFLEDELINLKGVGRHLESLAAEQERLEGKGVAAPTVSGAATPDPEKKLPSQGGNRCNFPVF
jgi:hypothetical protein